MTNFAIFREIKFEVYSLSFKNQQNWTSLRGCRAFASELKQAHYEIISCCHSYMCRRNTTVITCVKKATRVTTEGSGGASAASLPRWLRVGGLCPLLPSIPSHYFHGAASVQ